MKWRWATAAVVVVLCVALGVVVAMAATGRHAKSPQEFAACKDALRTLLHEAQTDGTEGFRPAECRDFTDEELNKMATEVMEEEFANG